MIPLNQKISSAGKSGNYRIRKVQHAEGERPTKQQPNTFYKSVVLYVIEVQTGNRKDWQCIPPKDYPKKRAQPGYLTRPDAEIALWRAMGLPLTATCNANGRQYSCPEIARTKVQITR